MTDFFAAAQRVIAMIMQGSELGLVTWISSGGIIYLLRGISFWIDCTLVSFIGAIYKYFMMLLKGELFNETLVSLVLKNVYIFIGIFVFFRLAMVLIKYMLNPELISDQKTGVNALIKRVIIGLAGIIMIPIIFDGAIKLQSSIIEDQLIQQLFIPGDMLEEVTKQQGSAGQNIGTMVLSGFINPSAKAPNKIKNEYEKALKLGDLSAIDFNSGGFLGIGYTSYDYSYFYLISTFVLAYVLYLMLKYCLDIVVRFFKLFLYQLLAPVAMIEYMINGSEDGVFKTWKNAVLSTYFMLFVRVMAIWFVVFVMTLMNNSFPQYTDGTLLIIDDYMLKALIVIGLLAFMMDLPKLVGSIFGLDLEQEGSASKLMGSIGGIVKGVGFGALAAGGAAIGGAVGSMSAIKKTGLNNLKSNRAGIKDMMEKNEGMTRKQARQALKGSEQFYASNAAALKESGKVIKSAGKGAAVGIGAALLSSTSAGKSVQSGYHNTSGQISSDKQKERMEAEERATADYRKHQKEEAEKQTGYARSSAAILGVKDSNDAELTAINGAMKTAGQSTISEQLTNLNTTSEVTRDHVVNIKDNVKAVVNTTNDIKNDVHTTASTVQHLDQTTDVIRNNTTNIMKHTDTIVNNTNTISQNTDTIVNQNNHISHKVDQIEDNTFYSGIDAIEKLDLNGSGNSTDNK